MEGKLAGTLTVERSVEGREESYKLYLREEHRFRTVQPLECPLISRPAITFKETSDFALTRSFCLPACGR